MGSKIWTTTAEFAGGTVTGLSTSGDELRVITAYNSLALATINTSTHSAGGLSGVNVGEEILPTADITVNKVSFVINHTSATSYRTVRIETILNDSPTGTLAWAGAKGCATWTGIQSNQTTIVTLETPGVMSSGNSYALVTIVACAQGSTECILYGNYDSTSYTGRSFFRSSNSADWSTAGKYDFQFKLLTDITAESSGNWVDNVDASSVVSWANINCTKVGAANIRMKTATSVATLGAASWVPATGYYTAFPATTTAVHNQYAQLEISITAGVTVQDITLDWALVSGGGVSSRFGLGISRKLHL